MFLNYAFNQFAKKIQTQTSDRYKSRGVEGEEIEIDGKINFTYLDSVMPYLQLNLNLLNKLGFTDRGMFFFIEMLKQIHIFT